MTLGPTANTSLRAHTTAQELDLLDRREFIQASAEDLSSLGDASVDAVTTHSVLIYVSAKQQVTIFRTHRVLVSVRFTWSSGLMCSISARV